MKKASWGDVMFVFFIVLHQEASWGQSLLFLSLVKSAFTWTGPTSFIYLVIQSIMMTSRLSDGAVLYLRFTGFSSSSAGVCFHGSLFCLFPTFLQEGSACSGLSCGPFWSLTVQILTHGYQRRREITLTRLWRMRWCRSNKSVKAFLFLSLIKWQSC